MGATSGKKGKGKGTAKQNNKKEKNQGGPDNQSFPTATPPEQQDQGQQEELQDQEQASSQTQQAVEQHSTPPESNEPSQYTTEAEDSGTQPATPNVAPTQPPVDDAQNDLQTPGLGQEELEASKSHSGTADVEKEKDDLSVPDDRADSPPQTPVAVAQTPLVSPAPASIPLPSPSLSEIRYTTSPTRSRTGLPANFNYASPPLSAAAPASRHASPTASFASPAAKLASPVPTTISPLPKVSSPLVQPYMPPAMSPHATPPVAPVGFSAPPSTAPSVVPAHHSPAMSSVGTVPPYMPYRHPSAPSMPPIPHGYVEPAYSSSFQAIRDLSMNGSYGLNKGAVSPPDNEQELVDLLQRIQGALPDIDRLMHGFKHTQGKLSSREAEFKHTVNQHAQNMMHKEYYIDALQSQLKRAAKENAEESTSLKNTISALRMELGNLQEKQRDLEENLAASGKWNEELSESKAELEEQITALNTSIQEAHETHEKELDRLKEEQEEALASQKQELTEFFEHINKEDEKTAAEALEAREKELLGQQESLKADHEKEKLQMQESHDALQSELDSKQSELASIKEELEAKVTELDSKLAELGSLHDEMAAKISELEETQKELDGARGEHETTLNELRQGHANEMQSLKTNHEEELSASAKVLADKLSTLKTYGEKEQQWAEEKSELENQLSQKAEELAIFEKEKEKLEGDGIVKEQQLQRATEEMRATINGLGGESDRLRKTLNSLGEATDLKNTKGDSFFLDSFDQLSRLVVALSKEHFSYIPIDPPKDILAKIPPELPPFLDNTPASRELRCAYVQHVVSKTLTYRIFQPFLFTLGRRYDKADTFFQMLSMDMRRKSVRREAFWRQQTLKAAYTASDAKQSINVVAAVIVDEIIDQIKHFADPKQLDALLTAVRKIVKLAAETWRLARVERELVIAALPPLDAEDESSDGWHEYGAGEGEKGGDGDGDGDGGHGDDGSARHVILRTFPQIMREAAHEDFADDEQKASRCVYAHGTVLYTDSAAVLARHEELAKKEEAQGSPRVGNGVDGPDGDKLSGEDDEGEGNEGA